MNRVLDDHAEALYGFALAVTDSPAAAVDVVREAVAAAVEDHGPSVSRAVLLNSVFDAALRVAAPMRTVPDDLLEPGGGSHEELRRICQQAIGVLEPRQRGILDLTLRQGLQGEQLGVALGVSPGQVSAATRSALTEAEHVLGAVLLSRVGQADCPGLAGVIARLPADSDGTAVAGEVVGHQGSCAACDDRRRALVPVASLLAGIPPTPAPPELRSGGRPPQRRAARHRPPHRPRRDGRRRRAARVPAGAVLGLLLLAAVAVLLRRDDDTPAPPALRPQLTLSVAEVDFRKDSSETTFEVDNTGDSPLEYELRPEVPWLTLAAPSSTLGPGEKATVVVKLDRSRAPEGQIRTGIRAARPASVAPLAVRAEVDRAPVVSKTELTPESLTAGSCPGALPAQVRVTIVEESGIERARLYWREPSGSERHSPLQPAANGTYTGALGPVPGAGEATWWVVAVDTRGNTTVSAPVPLAVIGC